MFKKYQLRYYNFRLVILLIITSVIGIFVINSAKDFSYALKQAGGLAAGLAILVFLSFVNYNWILKYFWVMYLGNLGLLLSVLLFGVEKNHAKRWIVIAGIQFQPSEISKIVLILVSAKLLSMFKDKINTWKFLVALGAVLGIPVMFVFAQPNLSTTLLTCIILFVILYCAGLSYRIIGIILITALVLFGAVVIDIQQPEPFLLKGYQATRIRTFLSGDEDEYSDSKFQQKYSVKAIGSGQLKGKGLDNDDPTSVKNGNYIVEAQTDFIFAVIGEELGFIGGSVIILLLALITLECIIAAIRAKDFTGRLICCGMAAWIAFQTFINIGVTTQLLPNTGLPLPFVSYGISSLLALFAGMGIVININMQRNSYDNI